MRRFTSITESLTVSDQITPGDVPALAAQGVKTIINNRPDHEEPNQPENAALSAAARAAGIAFIEQPVSFSTIQPRDGLAFGAHVQSAPGKVHAFCRTGRRCIALWTLANVHAMGTHAVLEKAATLGEDLRGLAPMLSEMESQ
jgi:sulfide:quinone oxidoreductase